MGNELSTTRLPPIFVAIVGGSGSGKSRLAHDLAAVLPGRTARLSLDDFYRDRSHLSPARRAQLNFDHPSSVDWPAFQRALKACREWRPARVPRYDFASHCRLAGSQRLHPKPFILVDGLWLLRRPSIRRLFHCRIFLDCPLRTRLRRRLARDRLARGRSAASVREQFWRTVEPMHRKFVLPQRRWADVIMRSSWGRREVKAVVADLQRLSHAQGQGKNDEKA